MLKKAFVAMLATATVALSGCSPSDERLLQFYMDNIRAEVELLLEQTYGVADQQRVNEIMSYIEGYEEEKLDAMAGHGFATRTREYEVAVVPGAMGVPIGGGMGVMPTVRTRTLHWNEFLDELKLAILEDVESSNFGAEGRMNENISRISEGLQP